ncbi:MAG TPA: DUF371 domain-containing protein [Nitrososphaera sp.]
MFQEEIQFFGHPNVQSLHARTIEITKEEHLGLKGDCIIGVRASKGCADIDEKIKRMLKLDDSVVNIEISVGSESFSITGRGDSRLTLLNQHDIVIRKSRFVCPRTMSVMCDKASSDLPRKMIRMLQAKDAKGLFRVSIE